MWAIIAIENNGARTRSLLGLIDQEPKEGELSAFQEKYKLLTGWDGWVELQRTETFNDFQECLDLVKVARRRQILRDMSPADRAVFEES